MRHALFPVTRSSVRAPAPLPERRGQRGLFALILDALHRSRRLQALRMLQRYRYLAARPAKGEGRVEHPERETQ